MNVNRGFLGYTFKPSAIGNPLAVGRYFRMIGVNVACDFRYGKAPVNVVDIGDVPGNVVAEYQFNVVGTCNLLDSLVSGKKYNKACL